MVAPLTTSLIADQTLSWINEQLRAELEWREAERVAQKVPAEFWKLQALRLLSFSLVGIGWLAIQIATGV